jgi:hypothetical protein
MDPTLAGILCTLIFLAPLVVGIALFERAGLQAGAKRLKTRAQDKPTATQPEVAPEVLVGEA